MTTRWWKLWGVCKLSISIERLGAGNRQRTRHFIHALRSRRTHIPEPQQRWVHDPCSATIERRKNRGEGVGGIWSFSLSVPADRKRGIERGREGGAAVISTVVLGCGRGREATTAAAASSSVVFTHDADVVVWSCMNVCVCLCTYSNLCEWVPSLGFYMMY